MRKIFVLLLAVTLSASAAVSAVPDASQPKKQEQRKSKKAEINRAFEILKSGRFKIEQPLTRDQIASGFFGGVTRIAAELDIADQHYKVRSAKIDSVKSVYTLDFAHQLTFEGNENLYTVIYNFKTGYLRVGDMRTLRENNFEGNYTFVIPLDEQ